MLPAVREQAGLGHGQLGTALLFIGAGALPAMLLTGPAVDRFGHRVTAVLQVALGCTGVIVALTGHGFVGLVTGLVALGAVSGAADVANNAAAASAERASGRRPVIARAHGVFSAGVVGASLVSGVLRGAGAAVAVPFLLAAAVGAAAGILTWAGARTDDRVRAGVRPPAAGSPPRRFFGTLRPLPLLVVGGLAALAFAVENAHQSWSAEYLDDVLSAGPAVAAAGPAVFAAVVAVARFAVAGLSAGHPLAVLIIGAAAAAAGTVVVAAAPTVAVALTGVGLAAAGTAVLYPTLLALAVLRVDESAKGTATSVVATIAYLGFLAGPVYVGYWAAVAGLPGAMVAVAAVAAGLALLTWPALRAVSAVRRRRAGSGRRARTPPGRCAGSCRR
ncbi:MFS transporter [Jiangella aurantiaca]|uniref:MFS transporter n=2 Tax=Jiangella aurantiaca TaxID=2530373 RepID=A0A4R5A9P3_9ACTN|nr:MFS transporter [Jiangella aurantiaca]